MKIKDGAKKLKSRLTIPSYTMQDTSDVNLKRYVDRDGNWEYYWNVKDKVFRPAVNHVLSQGYAKTSRFYDYLLSVSKEEAKKKLETAGEEGTRTHQAVRELISGSKVNMSTKYMNELNGRQERLNNDEWDNLIAFEAFCVKYKPESIAYEQTIESVSENYAGTFDWLGTILIPDKDKVFPEDTWNKRIVILLDWKTSSGIWPEYEAQLAAYWNAIDRTISFTGIVRLGTKHKNGGYEFKVWNKEETEENFERFLSAYDIANLKPFVPEVQNIPTEFFIKIPKAKLLKVKKTKNVKL